MQTVLARFQSGNVDDDLRSVGGGRKSNRAGDLTSRRGTQLRNEWRRVLRGRVGEKQTNREQQSKREKISFHNVGTYTRAVPRVKSPRQSGAATISQSGDD